jgi:hypothetical protein
MSNQLDCWRKITIVTKTKLIEVMFEREFETCEFILGLNWSANQANLSSLTVDRQRIMWQILR